MATATARAPQPGKKKGRPVAGRPLTNLVNSNDSEDKLTQRRTQRLVDTLGLTASRARLVADLAWGGPHG